MRPACFCGAGCLALATFPAAAAPRCCPRAGLGNSCRVRLVHRLALRRSRRDSLSRLGHLNDKRDDLETNSLQDAAHRQLGKAGAVNYQPNTVS